MLPHRIALRGIRQQLSQSRLKLAKAANIARISVSAGRDMSKHAQYYRSDGVRIRACSCREPLSVGLHEYAESMHCLIEPLRRRRLFGRLLLRSIRCMYTWRHVPPASPDLSVQVTHQKYWHRRVVLAARHSTPPDSAEHKADHVGEQWPFYICARQLRSYTP